MDKRAKKLITLLLLAGLIFVDARSTKNPAKKPDGFAVKD